MKLGLMSILNSMKECKTLSIKQENSLEIKLLPVLMKFFILKLNID